MKIYGISLDKEKKLEDLVGEIDQVILSKGLMLSHSLPRGIGNSTKTQVYESKNNEVVIVSYSEKGFSMCSNYENNQEEIGIANCIISLPSLSDESRMLKALGEEVVSIGLKYKLAE